MSDIDTHERVRAEQVRLLYVNGGLPMVMVLVVGVVMAWIMASAGALSATVAALWAGTMALHTGVRLVVRRAYFRAADQQSAWKTWANRFVVGALAGGVTWGVGAWLMLAPGRTELQMFLVMVLMAIVWGTAVGWGCYLPAFYVLFVPAFAPVIAWFALQPDTLHRAIVGLFLLWVMTVIVLARRHHASLVRSMVLSFENAALAADLRLQKQSAEQSSLAKSRFLAAASHDLRQPVHALGMFIGALRTHRLGKRSEELVDRMDASIGALHGLFGALLDVSRLDAGVIESRPHTVGLDPLIARICFELEAEAREKGLDIVVEPTGEAATSDPVLLERVLRNLIANAVRYTERGGVTVACRREGDQVWIEVRDTGPGIPPALHEAVFEEFYQIGNPGRDRSKGLGLGLPIVRRLTAILGHRLEMQSAPGEGTVFRIGAPAARSAAEAAAEAVAAEELPEHAVGARIILAIDDEEDIRSAMRELLGSWGHQVATASGADEALEALAAGLRPDLIVCDYQLGGPETGEEAIARLREAMGAAVPAILITGDTAPDVIRRASESGRPLLHKPLTHGKLRAAVNNLLRRAPARAAVQG